MRIVVTPAAEMDLDAIDEIERHSFKSPWSRQTFEGELLREWARIDVGREGSPTGRKKSGETKKCGEKTARDHHGNEKPLHVNRRSWVRNRRIGKFAP